jgi:hypothetical protein
MPGEPASNNRASKSSARQVAETKPEYWIGVHEQNKSSKGTCFVG